MSDVTPFKKTPSPHDFMRKVHEIAANESRIILTNHARKRMAERKVLQKHVDNCLLKGQVVDGEGPYINTHGNWQATLARRVAGINLRVSVAINMEEQLIVITIIKES